MTDIQKVSFAIACLNTSIVGASLMEAMHNRNDLGVVLIFTIIAVSNILLAAANFRNAGVGS